MYLLQRQAITNISELIGLNLDEVGYESQDWDLEFPNAEYVEKILSLFPDLKDSDDLLAAFAMLISSYEEYLAEKGRDGAKEAAIRNLVEQHPDSCKEVLKYWAKVDDYPMSDENYPVEDCWSTTPFARDLLKTVYGYGQNTRMYFLSQKSAAHIVSLLGQEPQAEGYTYREWNDSVAGPTDARRIIAFFPELKEPDDQVAAFALLIAAYDNYLIDRYIVEKPDNGNYQHGRHRQIENEIRRIVRAQPQLYKDVLDYWACIDDWPLEDENDSNRDAWAVTPFIRELLKGT